MLIPQNSVGVGDNTKSCSVSGTLWDHILRLYFAILKHVAFVFMVAQWLVFSKQHILGLEGKK